MVRFPLWATRVIKVKTKAAMLGWCRCGRWINIEWVNQPSGGLAN